MYLLCQILSFVTEELGTTLQHNCTQEGILSLMEDNRVKLLDRLLTQEVVRMVNPYFFSNVNETPLMAIVDSWFYQVLCTKQGLLGEELVLESAETKFELEEGNLFEL